MSKNPFPGPQPYRASDRALFYGREDLSYRLEGSVLANRCVTVYGPSGAGKSSLVQAAVIPSLIESQEIRVVRVDGWPEDREPTAWLAAAAYSNLGFGDAPSDLSPEDALLAAAQRAARRSPRLMLIYLDQIEQLLYASRNAAECEAFFDHVNRLVETPLRNLRVVLSLREDYLGRFRDRLRDHRRILDHGFRVGPLTVAELCSAVCQAAAAGEPPQQWEPDAMRELMLQVRVPGQSATDDAEAQSAYAQIVCRALFHERAQGGPASTHAGATQAEQILRRYLETTLSDLGPLGAVARRLLEDHLVSDDGSRTLRTEKELLQVAPAEDLSPILKALEGAAILHAEQRQGSRYFEIGHDWLSRKVFEQRQQRELAEASLLHEAERQRELAEQKRETDAKLEKARKGRRISVIIALISLVTVAVMGGSTVVALQQEAAAKDASLKEQKARDLAVATRILAGVRELSARGKLAWAMKLLLEVDRPAERRGWVELGSDALKRNALLATLQEHKGPLSAAIWSPDGEWVLTASADRTARIFRADGRGVAVVLKGHDGPVISAAWSPDGKHVITGSEKGAVRVWNVDGSLKAELKRHDGPVVSVAWSPEPGGKRVLTASHDETARIYNADGSGEPIPLSGHTGPLWTAIWSPDGAFVVTTSSDKTARVWKADGTGKPVVLKDHKGDVLSATMSADGARIVTVSRDKMARLWNASGKGDPVMLKGHEGSVLLAAFSPDGSQVATASSDRTARVWGLDGNELVVLRGHELTVSYVAWSPNGKYLATASSDKTARIWATDGSGSSIELNGHEAPLRSVTWNPDSQRVLTAASDSTGGSADHTAKIWSIEPLQSAPYRDPGGRAFHSPAITVSGDRVAAAYDNNTVALFSVDGSAAPVVLAGHEGWVASVAWSPDGGRVVTASFDTAARIFRADGTGDPIVLKGHNAAVRSAIFSPDGARVATISDDKAARVFRADSTGEPVVLRGHEDWLTSVAWSPDGGRVVTTSLDQTARVWNADGSGAAIVLTGHRGGINAAAFSSDGAHIVTASDDRTARVFPAGGGPTEKILRGHSGAVLRAIFSPDNKRIATSSADGTVRLWTPVGSSAPSASIVLTASAPVLAMVFLDNGERLFSVSSDNAMHTWMIDVDQLRKKLLEAHVDCLPPSVRRMYLFEPGRDAHKRYAECEDYYKRKPLVSEENSQ